MIKVIHIFFVLLLSIVNSQQIVCVEVDEGDTSNISCPNNSIIETVDFDSYGLPEGSCGDYQITSCHCEPQNTNDWIGTNSQSVYSGNSLCGDPCEHSVKHRYVQIGCSVDGCIDDNAINWDPDATIDNGSCEYAPVLLIPDQSINEDSQLIIDLSNYANDQDNDPLVFNLESEENANFNIVINESIFTLSPSQDYNGQSVIEISVSDGDNQDFDSFILQVIPINDSPSIQEPPYLFATDGELYTYVIRGEDVDDNNFTFQLITDCSNYAPSCNVAPEGMYVQEDFGFEARILYDVILGLYTPGQFFSFSVSLSDGEYEVVGDYTVQIVSSNNNTPPQILFESSYETNEDNAKVINFIINDDDSQINANNVSIILDYQTHNGSTFIQNQSVSGSEPSFQFTFDPYANWNGEVTMIVDVDDGSSWSSDDHDIIIAPINDNPIISDIGGSSDNRILIDEYESRIETIYVHDIDTRTDLNIIPDNYDDMMSCTIENLSDANEVQFNELDTGTTQNDYYKRIQFFTEPENEDWFGENHFIVTCIDGYGGEDSKNFVVEYLNVNDAPIMNDETNTNISTFEDQSIIIDISGFDIDDELLSFAVVGQNNIVTSILTPTITSNDAGYLINGQVEISPTMNYNTNYNEPENFMVYLIDGHNAISNQITYSLTINPVNDAPETTSFSVQVYEDCNEESSVNNSSCDDDPLEIDLNGTSNILVCNETLSDNESILCDCSHPALIGGCDIENTLESYSIVQKPQNGIIQLDGSIIKYFPNSNFDETDDFTYIVYDGELPSLESVVTIIVNPVNDAPTIETVENMIVQEDFFAHQYQLIIDDVDGDFVSHQIDFDALDPPSVGSFYNVFVNTGQIFQLSAFDNYNGEISNINIEVSDGELTDDITFNFIIEPVNDAPISNGFNVSVGEDCEDFPIELYNIGNETSDVNAYCNDSFYNESVLCQCSESINDGHNLGENLNFDGICDIDNISDFNCHIFEAPVHGTIVAVNENPNTIYHYTPEESYNGSDSFKFYCCNSGEDAGDCTDHTTVTINVGFVNDQPIFSNCIDDYGNILDDCNEIIQLNHINDSTNILYEDCSLDDAADNSACADFQGVSVKEIRTGYNEFSDDNLCSNSNTWYDTDCENQNDILYGIAVNSELDNLGIGNWEYSLNNDDLGFRDFIFINNDNQCDYILLDDEDKIRFVPNSNEYSETDNFVTYPSIVFYAWDQSAGNEPGDCVLTFRDEDNECNSTNPISANALRAIWEIKSVNDPFNLIMSDFTNAFILTDPFSDGGESTYLNISSTNNLITLYEDDIDETDGKVLSLILFSQNDENHTFFIAEDIDSELTFSVTNSNESLVSVNIEENKLNFNTLDNMNGTAQVQLNVSDGEFNELIEINVEVLQVNDPIDINHLTIQDGIEFYYNSSADEYINNPSMFVPKNDNEFFIKLQSFIPEYFPDYPEEEKFPHPGNYGDDILDELYNLSLLIPESPESIYFKWNNNNDYMQDIDTNPEYNSADNLYTIYYRLEFLDNNGKVYILKDNINYSEGEYAQTDELAKVSVNLMSESLQTYQITDESQCDYDIDYNEEMDQLDITGNSLYKWRISARNQIINDTDEETINEIACTSWSSSDQFFIDMTHPQINYNFVLNDIYIDFFDVYMSPSEPLNFYNGQQLYIHYDNSSEWVNEKVDIINLDIQNEEIYQASDNFNQYGPVGFTFVLTDAA